MQKVLLLAAAAAALSLASFSSAAVTQQGVFIGVNGGKSHYSLDHNDTNFNDFNDTAFGAVVGYRWVVDRPFSLGVEAGYVNLGQLKAGQGYIEYSYEDKVKGQALVLGGNGKWDLPHGFTITARAGYMQARTKLDERYTSNNYFIIGATPTTTHYHETSNDGGFYAGAGFGYDFNENIGITMTYDYYSFKASNITGDSRKIHAGVTGLAAEYRFW
jgi:OmpA-OmpF porin, OOP family